MATIADPCNSIGHDDCISTTSTTHTGITCLWCISSSATGSCNSFCPVNTKPECHTYLSSSTCAACTPPAANSNQVFQSTTAGCVPVTATTTLVDNCSSYNSSCATCLTSHSGEVNCGWCDGSSPFCVAASSTSCTSPNIFRPASCTPDVTEIGQAVVSNPTQTQQQINQAVTDSTQASSLPFTVVVVIVSTTNQNGALLLKLTVTCVGNGTLTSDQEATLISVVQSSIASSFSISPSQVTVTLGSPTSSKRRSVQTTNTYPTDVTINNSAPESQTNQPAGSSRLATLSGFVVLMLVSALALF